MPPPTFHPAHIRMRTRQDQLLALKALEAARRPDVLQQHTAFDADRDGLALIPTGAPIMRARASTLCTRRVPSALRSLRPIPRPPVPYRSSLDSPLEGDGFELPVPRAMQARLEAKIAGFGCMFAVDYLRLPSVAIS